MYGLKHQQEKRSMDYFAGLDVSVKETSVCIVDDTGKIVRELKVASEPEALLAVLTNPAHYRSGFTALWPKRTCRWSVSRRGTCRQYSRRRSTRRTVTMRAVSRR